MHKISIPSRLAILILFLAAVGSTRLWAQEEKSPPMDLPVDVIEEGVEEDDHRKAFEQLARFTLAMEQIHRLHSSTDNEASYEKLVDAAIKGMMSELDNYSGYMEDDNLRELRDKTRGAFVGVGVVINRGPRYVTVVSPIEDSPGWEAGLAAGDQIAAIDGESAKGASLEAVVDRLKGEPGTDVEVRIRRPSENRSFSVTLTRRLVENKSVANHQVLDNSVGYVRIKTFTQNTARLMRGELTGLKKKGVEKMILDLRGNPGGLLESAVEVAGLFLPLDTLVVYTEGAREEKRKEYRTPTRPHRLEPELIILVNEGSASAAEVVSGALQDYKRARLVGTQTFGKASVQSIIPLPDGSALRLTTAQYFTPNERQIHEIGIEPDETVALSMPQWLRLRGRNLEESEWEKDPQLKRAVELLLADLDSGDEEG